MGTLSLTGGTVLLPDLTVERADILADTETGTITAVGDPNEIEGRDVDEKLDATDGLVIPGLINAHTHVAMTLFRGAADDKELDTWLREDIWPVEAALTAEDVRAGTALGLAEMIRSGTTAFADMYFFMPEVADVAAASGMRARLGHGCITEGKDEDASHAEFEDGLAFAREHDGRADGRIRTMFTPHSLTTVDEAFYREYLPLAHEEGIPVHIHANETTNEVTPIVEERGVRPLEYADDLGLLTEDAFLAHGVHVDASERELLAERGTSVVHCPASNMKLASGMAPIQAMHDAGVTVGLGTDGAGSNNDLDMFDEMRDAAMIGKLATDDPTAVPAPDVVEMATRAGAEILGFDSGQIAVGANADFAVLDLDVPHLTPPHDLVSHLVYAARGSDVRHTVCDGQVLMRERELQTFDLEMVMDAARKQATELFERAK